MDLYLKSFNGFDLNNSNYQAAIVTGKNPPDATPVFISQANADSEDAGTFTLGALSIPLTIRIKGLARNVLESQLKEALRPGTYGELVATYTDEGRDYQKTCRVVSITASTKHTGLYTVVLQTGESTWRTATDVTDTWSVTASGQTKSITVGGYSETALSFDIYPTGAPGGGWAFQRLYQLINKVKINHGTRPWMIELDTAALVTAGKMQADCDDLIVLVDGLQVRRWIADPNTDHTAIWINLTLAAGQSLTLLTPVASSGSVSELVFAKVATNYTALNALPARGYLVHGTEWFEYSAKDPRNYKVTISSRGALSTTMQAHNASDVFQWIQHPIVLMYGNPTATDPADDDDDYDNDKPVFDLSSSDNTSWVYTATSLFFSPELPNRPGSWKPVITKRGDVSGVYHFTQDAASGNPAMGLKMGSWLKLGKPAAESATLQWQFNHPGGISSITTTGAKYRETTTWPGTSAAQMQRGKTASSFVNVFTDTTPSTAESWEAANHSSVSITGEYPWIRFVLTGSMKAEMGSLAAYEVLTATVNFVALNQPDGSLLAEKASLLLDLFLANGANDDTIELKYPLLLYSHLNGDGESHEITLDDVNAHNALILTDKGRSTWIRLEPGSNTLTVTGDNVGAMTITFRWKERRI